VARLVIAEFTPELHAAELHAALAHAALAHRAGETVELDPLEDELEAEAHAVAASRARRRGARA